MDGVEINDLRSPTVHSKETKIRAGRKLMQHLHAFDHISILATGTVAVKAGEADEKYIKGPAHLIIKAGVKHEVRAVTDVVWYCIHSPGPDAKLNDFEG